MLIQINETEDKNKIWNQITIYLRTQWENYQLLKNGMVTLTIWKKIWLDLYVKEKSRKVRDITTKYENINTVRIKHMRIFSH